ncbi:hypothetical protein REPUB_Repub01dG0239300 [Reevesia pubescens]
MFVWLIYLLADWMATVVLATLRRSKDEIEPRDGLIAFWTPFLLWHLGGPYNITAYSIEDNELWLRHFLGMVFQVVQAIYIYSIYANDPHHRTLKFIGCPLFIAGCLKYGERIWALRSASDRELLNSIYSAPTQIQGSGVDDDKMKPKMIRTGLYSLREVQKAETLTGDSEQILHQAYSAFDVFKPLFLDLPFELSKKCREDMVYLKDKSEEQAFKMVEIELEFLYDMHFTKLPIQHGNHHGASLALRLFCFGSSVSALIAFSFIPKHGDHHIPKIDLIITYLLLGQVILSDLCSYVLRSWSNWIVMKFPGHKLYSLPISPKLRHTKPGLGIKVMAQHDLIKYYVKQASKVWLSRLIKFIDTNDLIQKFWYTSWRPVDHDLKKFIYSHLQQRRQKCIPKEFEFKFVSELLEGKGKAVLVDKYHLDQEDWNIDTTDFTSRIFLCHVATELVYYDDVDKFRGRGSSCKIGKSLSDYMMYLVLVRPLMLPKGFNEVINRLTYTQASKFFHFNMRSTDSRVAMKDFTRALLSFQADESPSIYSMTGSSFENILFKGLKFAKQLQDLARQGRWDDDDKWELISEVWMEMMIYAASHCSWKEHAQQLRHGGELLTHVALLMAHFGLSTQIQQEEKSLK